MIFFAAAALASVLGSSPAAVADGPALPGAVSRAYTEAQGALRQGDDGAAVELWKKARTLFDALPADQRYDRAVRDAAVRHELHLADAARARFDRIAPDDVQNAAEKQRLFLLLVGDPQALGGDAFAGAYRRVAELNPGLKGVHCQRADVIAKYHRWLALLPCPEGVVDEECEVLKAKAADEDVQWKDEVARATSMCRE
jgi:hypothetical protein